MQWTYGIAYFVRAVIYARKMFMKSATKRPNGATTFSITTFSIATLSTRGLFATVSINVEGVTLVLPSRLFMLNKYWRILALS